MEGSLGVVNFPSGKQTKVKVLFLVGIFKIDVHSRLEKPRHVISVCEYVVGVYF